MKKIIVTPPNLFDNSNRYLNYISQLVANKSITLELIKSIPLIVNAPKPISTNDSKLGSPETMLQQKLFNMHAEKLVEVITYFQNKNIQTEYSIGFKDPKSIQERNSNFSDFLLWILEVSSENNIWNELMGTKETQLAKQVDLPCLCIPSEYQYIKPTSLLVITSASENLIDAIPSDIIDEYELDTTLLLANDLVNIADIQKQLGHIAIKGQINVLSLKELAAISTFSEYIEQQQPSWIAYHNFDKTLIERIYNQNTNQFILSARRPIIIM